MGNYLQVIYESVTEISPDEVMGALAIGLTMALACHGACLLARKRSSNPLTLLCGLVFLVSTISMAIGLGHSYYKLVGVKAPVASEIRPPFHIGPGGPPRGPGDPQRRLIRSLLDGADVDANGEITPEEAARFVREADKAGKGWLDASDLDRKGERPDGPTPPLGGPPPPANPAGPDREGP